MWLPIYGYEGIYEISDFGEVKSLNYNHTGKEKILAKKRHRSGYDTVVLCKTQKRKISLYIFLSHKRL